MNLRCSLWLALAFVAGWGCAARRHAAPRPALINHVVLFKLEQPADRVELIADCERRLIGIPSVSAYACGGHFDIGRQGVDSDYDVGLLVGFDSRRGYEAYLDHPDHLALVEEWRPRVQWIRIHDFRDQSP